MKINNMNMKVTLTPDVVKAACIEYANRNLGLLDAATDVSCKLGEQGNEGIVDLGGVSAEISFCIRPAAAYAEN